jgi:hypothetical protein
VLSHPDKLFSVMCILEKSLTFYKGQAVQKDAGKRNNVKDVCGLKLGIMQALKVVPSFLLTMPLSVQTKINVMNTGYLLYAWQNL